MSLPPRFEAPHYQGSGKLEGMSALITGGDSGIGRAVAVLFAREGADVAIVYLNEHEDAKRTIELVQAEGRRCIAISGDVKSARFCKAAAAKTVKAFGKLNLLVNNAAFQEHASSLADLTEERFEGEGYGLPNAAGPGETLVRDGAGWRLQLDRVVDPLVVLPLPAQQMRVLVDERPAVQLGALSRVSVAMHVERCAAP